MRKATSVAFILFFFSAASAALAQPARAEGAPTLPLGTDLSDLVRYDFKILPDSKVILESMQPDSPFFGEWFEAGAFTQIALDSRAATPAPRSPAPLSKERWRGPVAIQAAPYNNGPERVYVIAAAMLSTSAAPEITFRRFKVTLMKDDETGARKVTKVKSLNTLANAASDLELPEEVRASESKLKDFSASQMTFKISAGLKFRVFLMTDVEHGMRFAFPIGVGGIDQGLDTKIANMGEKDANVLTPMIENARLDRATIWSHRGDARHFRNEPFLRVMRGKNAHGAAGWTAVGFHITIMGDGAYAAREKVVQSGLRGADRKLLTVSPPEWLTRGFDSHGCMRMRRNDLRFVHDLAMTSDKSRVIEVRIGMEAEPEHNKLALQGQEPMTEYTAWPLEDKLYKRVTAFEAPFKGHDCALGSSYADGKPRYACRADDKEHLTMMEQLPWRGQEQPVSWYTLVGIPADQREYIGKLYSMAEGRDADPRVAPPPCLEEPCSEPVVPNLAEVPALSSDPRQIVAPVPRVGASSSGATSAAGQ